ncbi:uncharacterized protein LOC104651499 [Saimiri boliviensis]|uniref:uncharacterized protein LOC104651499 n=1 Tax=Saimiri boliviensis TaxID=27679 RepID=UPI00193DA128|nr:uncharacterized protein LOC104651499 [Saimiri boliviensis boliviensis]
MNDSAAGPSKSQLGELSQRACVESRTTGTSVEFGKGTSPVLSPILVLHRPLKSKWGDQVFFFCVLWSSSILDRPRMFRKSDSTLPQPKMMAHLSRPGWRLSHQSFCCLGGRLPAADVCPRLSSLQPLSSICRALRHSCQCFPSVLTFHLSRRPGLHVPGPKREMAAQTVRLWCHDPSQQLAGHLSALACQHAGSSSSRGC